MPEDEETTIRLLELDTEIQDLASDIMSANTLGISASTDMLLVPIFKTRLSRLDDIFDKFESRVSEAKLLAGKLSRGLDDYTDMVEKYRNMYYDTLALNIPCRTDEAKHSIKSSRSNNSGISSSILPKLEFPHFDGDMAIWPYFKDTFETLIHTNPELDPVRKFLYLTSVLKGEAAEFISYIGITAAGYSLAWETLVKRYDNKRIQGNNILMKIFKHKPMNETLTSLEEFSSVFLPNVHNFINLKLDDPVSFILCTFALQLMEPSLRLCFETEFDSTEALPNITDLSNFVHRHLMRLQMNDLMFGKHSTSDVEGKNSLNNSREFKCCPICRHEHRLMDCPTFLDMEPLQRFKKAKYLKRCLNCLSAGHSSKNCFSKNSCRHCHQRHHSLLHRSKPL
ncbi:uncharacterized protein LOC106661621 [Cimex lectularius]|uniref:Uncharacterized protein n=1 Tax=Cimex lectularius TaxID=79782 RepID=A0A8I6R7L5_CIMLE|nr:uncharacterized protein LOC106661621 [Cimex lectularius]XP_014240631.1 uncharacterized protein LOC106661621 [Cimex lectularius]